MKVKKCKRCDLLKTEENKDKFYISKSGCWPSCCKECNKAKSKEWIKNNSIRYKQYQKEFNKSDYRKNRRKEWNLWSFNLKKNKPCMDCKIIFHPVCMEYDHREPKDKLHDISYMVSSGYKHDTILAEISKCDLVCANCHRMRELKRGTYKDLFATDQP